METKKTSQEVFRNPHPVSLCVNDAANALGVSPRTVWNLVRKGTLPALRIGSRVLILYSALVDFATERADTSGDHTRPDCAERIAKVRTARKAVAV